MKLITALFLCISTCNYLFAQGKFQMSIPSGSYKVGFRQKVYFDPGRPPIAEQRQPFQNGRAVHMSIWYPASVKNGSRTMNFNGYVDFFNSMINPDPPTTASKKKGLSLINFYMSQVGGDTVLFKQNLPELLSSPTHAYPDAPYQPGDFPIVIYPEAAYLNSLFGEYLASHGYIVVALSRFGTHDAEFEWQNVRGIETLVQDLQFASGIIKQEYKLNSPKIAAMGVGMNASAGLAWMMRNPQVGALVSLEGGILTGYEFGLIQKSPFYSIEAANKPMLVFYSPHEAVDPSFIDHYKYADRYMAFLPKMKEFYYLNYGVWESSMKNLLGPSPGDTKKGFEIAAVYTLQFLNATLKKVPDAKSYLEKSPGQLNHPSDLITWSRKNALPIPPTKGDLDKIFASSGFSGLMNEARKYLKDDRSALSYEIMSAFGSQLIQSGSFEEGLQWAALFQEGYPGAVAAYTISGRCNLGLNRKEQALAMYTKAMQLLPTDEHLDEAARTQLKAAIGKRLEELKS